MVPFDRGVAQVARQPGFTRGIRAPRTENDLETLPRYTTTIRTTSPPKVLAQANHWQHLEYHRAIPNLRDSRLRAPLVNPGWRATWATPLTSSRSGQIGVGTCHRSALEVECLRTSCLLPPMTALLPTSVTYLPSGSVPSPWPCLMPKCVEKAWLRWSVIRLSVIRKDTQFATCSTQ